MHTSSRMEGATIHTTAPIRTTCQRMKKSKTGNASSAVKLVPFLILDRLDMHHEIMLQLLEGKIHLALIGDSPQRILDIGTGTGIWAVDCADTYSSTEVIGTDLR